MICSYKENVSSPCHDLTGEKFLSLTRDEKTRYNLEQHRYYRSCPAEVDRKEAESRANRYKRLLPTAIWQCRYADGSMNHNDSDFEPSGLFALDLDHVGSASPSALPHREGTQSQAIGADSTAVEGAKTAKDAENNKNQSTVDTTPSPLGEGQGRRAPTTFKGIPYSMIISRWWRDVEKCPESDNYEPAPGNRNTPIMRLACELTFLLDDNVEWIREVLPTYGLRQAEFDDIIQRAVRYKKDSNRMYVSRQMKSLLQTLNEEIENGEGVDDVHAEGERNDADEDGDDEWDDDNAQKDGDVLQCEQSYSLTSPPDMPHGVQEFVDCARTTAQQAVAAVSALIGWGVLLSHLRAKVSNGTLEQLPIMLAYCWGKTVAGKTTLTRSVVNAICGTNEDQTPDTLRGMDNVLDRYWHNVQRKAKATGGGAKKTPVLPDVPIRCMADDFTPAAFLKAFMDADGLGALLYCPEHDLMTINGGMTAWKQIDARLRTMYDGEWVSARRVSVNAVSGKARAIGCCMICGTDSNVATYFTASQALNGLGNRIIFLHLTTPEGKRIFPRPLSRKEALKIRHLAEKALGENVRLNETEDEDGDLAYEVERMPNRQLSLSWLWDRLEDEFEVKRVNEFLLQGKTEFQDLPVRCKEVAFRAGMVLYWLWGCKRTEEYREKLVEACLWVADTMLNGLLELFGHVLERGESPLKLSIPQPGVWDLLPDAFRRADLLKVLNRLERKENPYSLISKWRHLRILGSDEEGVIDKIGGVYYKKGSREWQEVRKKNEECKMQNEECRMQNEDEGEDENGGDDG